MIIIYHKLTKFIISLVSMVPTIVVIRLAASDTKGSRPSLENPHQRGKLLMARWGEEAEEFRGTPKTRYTNPMRIVQK